MKKHLFYAVLAVASALLTGCSTTPAPEPVAVITPPPVAEAPQSILPAEMQNQASAIVTAGNLAVVGTAESKSLDLAMNRAKVNGRLALADLLNAQIEALAKSFSEETGIPYESLLLSGFNNTTRILSAQIAGSVAQALKYEQTGETFTAYAVMALDRKVIIDQLAKETDLYTRLKETKAYKAFIEAPGM